MTVSGRPAHKSNSPIESGFFIFLYFSFSFSEPNKVGQRKWMEEVGKKEKRKGEEMSVIRIEKKKKSGGDAHSDEIRGHGGWKYRAA